MDCSRAQPQRAAKNIRAESVENSVGMAGGEHMKAWGLAAILFLATWVAGCGGNSTTVGITITGPSLPPLTIIVNQSAQFTATVTGISTSTVFWQVCEPPTVVSTTIPPTMCTPGQGPTTGCTISKVATPITGFGTITANGLYTAPPTVPSPAKLLIVATSCIRANAFETFQITIDSGIRVQVIPSSASVGPGEHFQFTDVVTGTNNSSVVWMVNTVPGGDAADGFICPSNAAGNPCTPGSAPGEYFAPGASPGAVTVAAQSGADPTQQGTATVSVGNGGAPGFSATSPLEPSVAAQGSVQQDVYISGTNFLSTTQVFVDGVALPVANVILVSGTLIRATIPAAQLAQAGLIDVELESQDGSETSGTVTLQVAPVRPVVIASSPVSVQSGNGGANLTVSLTGGYFVAGKTTATFDGLGCGGGSQVCTNFVDSRHLAVSIQDGGLTSPGLYPLVVQSADALAAGVPSVSGLNLAVNPNPASISAGAGAPIAVGAGPSAIAVDEADGIAVVANTSAGTVSLINMNATPPAVTHTIAVGTAPTGVAVDDMLPHHMAYVVNSGSNSVSAIDLSIAIPAVVQTLSLASYEPSLIPANTVPWSIGANPLTHRAYIANQSTNVGTVIDLQNANTNLIPACTVPPCPVSVVTGDITPFGTGIDPQVSVDPVLNWVMATPGGTGTIGIVDLGRAPSPGDVGRVPQLVASLSISSTVQGVGINTVTHEALLADPASSTLTTFSLLDQTVTSVRFLVNGTALNTPNLAAAAVTPLENIGIAVQNSQTGATGVVADLDSGVVLQQITGLGSKPEAVAVDPATNQAIIANSGDGTVSIVSLGPALTPPQILEASPAATLATDGALQLVLTGSNFLPSSVVRLDQGSALGGITLPAPTASGCTVTCRQLTVTVPAGTLSGARHFLLDVENPGGVVSNVTDFTVYQAVAVGTTPIGVAVDIDRDSAVVTNSIDNTASLVSLTPVSPAFSPQSLGPVGVVGPAIPTGTTPEGVAIDPLLGIAVVANNGENDATVIDETTSIAPPPIPLCGSDCVGPTAVAMNSDTSTAVITNTNSNALFSTGELALLGISRTSTAATTSISGTLSGEIAVDQDPVAVAVDPDIDFAGVATASSSSALDIVDLASEQIVNHVENLQNPSGVVFDPVNQIFVVVNSLLNDIFFTDPNTAVSTVANVGIAPTSVDYNYQTSSLVTVNAGSHTMSILDYTCPPNTAPACLNPQVRTVLTLGGAQTTALVLGPNAIAIDPKLNLAVLVDPDNNRVLLVPLPH
jgi:DNA-binding beta-propeller fold protein YncE